MSHVIYINGRFLLNKPTGIENFAYGMCKAMANRGIEFVILTPKSPIKYYDVHEFNIIQIGLLKGPVWEQVDLSIFMLGKSSDILISFSGAGSLLIRNQIITIHDIAVFKHPEWFSFSYRILYELITPFIIKKSRAIITVSEFSKREISNVFKVNPQKIIVTYSATKDYKGDNFVDTVKGNNITEPYILAVSSIDPRKNFRSLIKGFAKSNIPCNLYIIGKKHKSFNDSNIEINTDKIKFLGYVSEAELIDYYKNAIAFISVSLYEGFGLPPIEAMSFGCPTITSDLEVCHEVCKNASYFVNQNDIESIASGIKKLYYDASTREKLVKNGYVVSKMYSFHNSLQRLISGLPQIKSCSNIFQ